jgi:hypothetical protein
MLLLDKIAFYPVFIPQRTPAIATDNSRTRASRNANPDRLG